MMDFQILPSVKVHQFFDRPAVLARLSRQERRFLNRAGAATRLTARRSIRKRKGISRAGDPPFSHTGRLRNGILYGLDQSRESVVIGPNRLWNSKATGRSAVSLLEHGGSVQNENRVFSNYRPRPFMRPALQKITPRLPRMFADA